MYRRHSQDFNSLSLSTDLLAVRQRRVLIHQAEECLHYVIVAEAYSDLAQLTGRLALTCAGHAAGADSADLLPIVATSAED